MMQEVPTLSLSVLAAIEVSVMSGSIN